MATTGRPSSRTPRSSASPRARTSWSGRSPSPSPTLWWPWAFGDQDRYDVTVEAVAEDGAVSHTLERRVGLRSLVFDDWRLSVNGERLFLKGANLAPTRALLGEATGDDVRQDVDLARDAGLDLVRVHAHIATPALYDQADERGMLVWQDLPLQWGYARSVRKQAVRQARKAVEILGHHPSIAIWCGHNEPLALDVADRRDGRSGGVPASRAHDGARAWSCPTWNKTVLDRSIKRALEKADGSRPVIPHSGVLAPPPPSRRHRQPPLLRLVPRRRAGPARRSPPPCPAWSAS